MKVGDRVRHRRFGSGSVLEMAGKTVLVEWETHRVSRERDRPGRTPLGKNHSHVNLAQLTLQARSETGAGRGDADVRAMAVFLFPSSFRCACGHECHFGENTVREMREISVKRRRPQTIGDGSRHGVEFSAGVAVAVLCPERGRCVIEGGG
jgi:hypothetical protein